MKIGSVMKHHVIPGVLMLVSTAASAVTITVTTTADQDGSDMSHCSLREAVRAINSSTAYGGCPAGLFRADNRIQLPAGTFLLNSELAITQEITISGPSTYRRVGDSFGTTEPDLLTGNETSRIQPLATIKPAAGAQIRLINASGASGGVELTDLILEGGNPAVTALSQNYGGAILSSVSVSLDNVRIRGSQAARGGAIYMSGPGGLVLSDSELAGNSATETGGAVGMSCYQDGNIARSIDVTRTAFHQNTSSVGAGVLQLCGNVTADLKASTISQNTSAASSAAVHFRDDFGASAVTISLDFVTAARNAGGAVIRSSGAYEWSVKRSVFAANASNCAVTDANPDCTAVTPLADPKYVAQDVVVTPGMTVFVSDQYQLYGGLVGGYLPALASPILDVVTSGCGGTDQRNISREDVVKCDIGALERLQLAALEDSGENKRGDNRIAFVDVLANDLYGEDGSAAPLITKPESFVIVNKSATETSSPACAIDSTDPEKPLLKVNNGGVVTTATTSIKCYYRLTDGAGVPFGDPATAEVSIENIRPVARSDSYVRPVGVTTVYLDLLANDDDFGDGTGDGVGLYGTPKNKLVIMINGDRPAPGSVKTQLGVVVGEEVDCEDVTGSAVEGSVCFKAGTLTYRADNNLSPFTEQFGYSIYDAHNGEDALESLDATVTITTDAPDPEKKGGGSVDWVFLALLSLAGLRLSRRL